MNFLLQLVLGVVLSFAAALLMPRQKTPKQEIKELDNPTADAGREQPVVFGTMTIESPNVLWYGEKETSTYEVDA